MVSLLLHSWNVSDLREARVMISVGVEYCKCVWHGYTCHCPIEEATTVPVTQNDGCPYPLFLLKSGESYHFRVTLTQERNAPFFINRIGNVRALRSDNIMFCLETVHETVRGTTCEVLACMKPSVFSAGPFYMHSLMGGAFDGEYAFLELLISLGIQNKAQAIDHKHLLHCKIIPPDKRSMVIGIDRRLGW